ncbi:MAG: ECF-type sigma factor, partial [Acidobacteriota bacterium]
IDVFERWKAGDSEAESLLTPTLYAELRHLAGGYLRRERAGHTLQPTALVNEAMIRLFGSHAEANERAHLVALAARTMRQVLVDHARRHQADKRISPADQVPLDAAALPGSAPSLDILALDEALEQLARVSPRAAQVVELRYFGGLTIAEAAEALDVSDSSVEREWRAARTWLRAALRA